MRALIWEGPRRIRVGDVAEPEAGDGEVVVNVLKAGICGSDLHAFRGEGGRRVPPLVLGHEAVGTLDGDDRLVAVFPLAGCSHCDLCRVGMPNLCTRRSLLGLDRQGTFAERVAVPRECVLEVPPGLPASLAALAEPFATSLAALSGRDVGEGTRVVVIGCGSIGLLALHYARLLGALVEVVDPAKPRRQAAMRLGASVAHASVEDLVDGAADLAVDAVGVEATWTAALGALAPGGTAVVLGLGQYSGAVPVGLMVRSGLRLEGSYAYGRDHFSRALDLLASSPPEATWVSEVQLDGGPEAFGILADSPDRAVKILVDFESAEHR